MPDAPLPPELVVVGATSRDRTPDDPRGWRLGGGVSYASLAIARLGLRVGALAGVDADAGAAHELARLREAGVDVRPVSLASAPIFDNIETDVGRRQVAHAASARLRTAALPDGWRAAKAWLLTPIAGELPEDWAAVPASEALVAVGWQGLLRDVRAGRPVVRVAPRASALLGRADIVGVSRDDLEGEVDLEALCRLLRPGATLLITAGAGGGLVVEVGRAGPRRIHRYPAITPDATRDPTGAGDVFLAAVLAARARPGLVGGRLGQRLDLLLAAAAASLVVERPGLDGVPDRTAVRRRLAEAGARGARGVG
ncbi:MAG TPA: PfkB family carbohydrate kinase [Clostridia bacterium]|nr:PfkB family carbohydrate kinase [Clostridia bacterium]